MLQRPDLDAETLSKQLDIDKVKEIHKRKAQFFNRSKKSEVAPKKRQTNPLAKKKRKKPQKEQELFESSDALSELSSELEESDEEQPTAKAATATGAQAQTNGRYPRPQGVPGFFLLKSALTTKNFAKKEHGAHLTPKEKRRRQTELPLKV